MPRLAFATFGVLLDDWDQPLVKGFVDRIPGAFEAAETGDGFIDRAQRAQIGSPVTDWGTFDSPSYIDPEEYPRIAATLSLWEDLESIFAFAYAGAHGEALKHGKEWIKKEKWSTYAAWWVNDDHTPHWSEVKERLEILYEHGSTPQAFTFKQPYGPDGAATKIDQARVKAKMAKNASKQVAKLDGDVS